MKKILFTLLCSNLVSLAMDATTQEPSSGSSSTELIYSSSCEKTPSPNRSVKDSSPSSIKGEFSADSDNPNSEASDSKNVDLASFKQKLPQKRLPFMSPANSPKKRQKLPCSEASDSKNVDLASFKQKLPQKRLLFMSPANSPKKRRKLPFRNIQSSKDHREP